MRKLQTFILVVFLASVYSCAQSSQLKKVDFLVGTWKVEGRENYESWKKEGAKLVGESYKMTEGKKRVSETLEIKFTEGKIVYTATVLNQNQGRGIPFKLNEKVKELFSFENLQHDFPNKIQYKILSKTELQVSVLGKDGKGFSYTMIKK